MYATVVSGADACSSGGWGLDYAYSSGEWGSTVYAAVVGGAGPCMQQWWVGLVHAAVVGGGWTMQAAVVAMHAALGMTKVVRNTWWSTTQPQLYLMTAVLICRQ